MSSCPHLGRVLICSRPSAFGDALPLATEVKVLTAELDRNPFPDLERREALAKELGMDKKR